MPKPKTVEENLEELLNKVDDLKWLFTLIVNADFDSVPSNNMFGAMNCIRRIIEDIEKDIMNIQIQLQENIKNKTVI